MLLNDMYPNLLNRYNYGKRHQTMIQSGGPKRDKHTKKAKHRTLKITAW